jgi:hypothetical protein
MQANLLNILAIKNDFVPTQKFGHCDALRCCVAVAGLNRTIPFHALSAAQCLPQKREKPTCCAHRKLSVVPVQPTERSNRRRVTLVFGASSACSSLQVCRRLASSAQPTSNIANRAPFRASITPFRLCKPPRSICGVESRPTALLCSRRHSQIGACFECLLPSGPSRLRAHRSKIL